MDENLHSIDDLFKNAISEHEEAPSSKVSELLERNLEKRHVVSITQKYKQWKWAAAALLIFSVGMAMYTINLKLRYKEATSKNKLRTPIDKDNISSEKVATTNKGDYASNAQSENNALQSKDSNKSLQFQAHRGNVPLNNRKPLLRKRIGQHVQLESAVAKNSINGADKVKTVEGSNIKLKLIAQAVTPKEITLSQQKSDDKRSLQKVNSTVEHKTIKEEEQVVNLPFLQRIELNDFLAAETQSVTNIQSLLSLQKMQLPSTISQNSLSATISNNKAKLNRPDMFSAKVFVSADHVSTQLKNDHPNFREDDKNKIKSDEQDSRAFSAGVLGQLNFASKFSLELGFSLSTRITDIKAKTIFARADNKGNVNYRISCSSGYAYVSTKSGSRPNQGDSITSLSSKNTLQYFSVPVGLQYTLNFGKFDFAPAFVLSTNVNTKGKVETVLSTGGNNENTTTTNIEGLKPVYLDAGPRLDIVYNLNKMIGIGLSPSARFALSSITKDGPVKTYLNSFGLAAAIKIRL